MHKFKLQDKTCTLVEDQSRSIDDNSSVQHLEKMENHIVEVYYIYQMRVIQLDYMTR